MASTFKILQWGKAEIKPKCKVTNKMVNYPYALQSFYFYFNNGTTIYTNGGGGFGYGEYRDSEIIGINSTDDFPLTITSYKYQNDKTSGMYFTVNLNPYTYADFSQGKILEIDINSYV